jgi:uncharacterized protein (DUF433 family)
LNREGRLVLGQALLQLLALLMIVRRDQTQRPSLRLDGFGRVAGAVLGQGDMPTYFDGRPAALALTGAQTRSPSGNTCRASDFRGGALVVQWNPGYTRRLPMIQRASGIESNPEVMDGLPVISGTRVPVYLILEMLESGLSLDAILQEYPHLTLDQLRAAVSYARELVQH